MKRRGEQAASVAGGLCIETKGREILAKMVHDEIDAAMRIGRFDPPAQAARGRGAASAPVRPMKRAR